MPNDSQKPVATKDTKRPRLKLVSAKDEAGEKLNSELVGFFQAFEDALMKEVETILNL